MRMRVVIPKAKYFNLPISLSNTFWGQYPEWELIIDQCHAPGCYVGFVDDGPNNCLYVGQSFDVCGRLVAHARTKGRMHDAGLVLFYPLPMDREILEITEEILIKYWYPLRNKKRMDFITYGSMLAKYRIDTFNL